jgi:hypothetical protein
MIAKKEGGRIIEDYDFVQRSQETSMKLCSEHNKKQKDNPNEFIHFLH